MATTNPVIYIIPGAWHTPEAFDVVRASLHTKGYESVGLSLPSVGAEPAVKTLEDDTMAARAGIKALVEAGKNVVVVAHSYGGVVASNAVEDLGFATRKAAGKVGGVVDVTYLAAFALPKSVCLLDALGGTPLPWMNFKGDYSTADTPTEVFYADISATEQQRWIAKLKTECVAVFSGKSTYEPWKFMPCSYIFCDQDKALLPVIQQSIAGMMGNISTVHINASHSPFLSQPDAVVDAIVGAAKYGLEKSGADVSLGWMAIVRGLFSKAWRGCI